MVRKGQIGVIAAVATIGMCPGLALAGTLQVNVNLGANNTANGCNIFSVNGGGTGILVTPPCQPPPIGGPAQLGFAFIAGNLGHGPINTASQGERVGIQTTAPAGITIVSAVSSPAEIANINNGNQWGGGAYWAGGGRQWRTGDPSETDGPFASTFWGWQMVCGAAAGCTADAGIALNSVLLTGEEDQGPSIVADGANNLVYQSSHFVWNPVGQPYPIPISTSDPSGVCRVQAMVNGTIIPGPAPTPDQSHWQQCPNVVWTAAGGASVDTRSYVPGAGTLTLQLQAVNAAQVPTTDTEALKVDNDPVGLTLSGPTDAASATGATQFVTTNVTAGPSGVAGARCAVDGGPSAFYSGATGQVPVSGLGAHSVTCVGENNAVGPAGQPGTSAPQTFDLSIRQPTASAITFARVADALRCRTTTQRVKMAGRLHTVRRHGKRVKVRGRARTVRKRVRKCHARTVIRTVRVVLKRHGKPVLRHGKPVYVKRRVRRVQLPHAVYKPIRRIGHGKHTTVNGFVVLANGTALTGQPVDVYSSPNDNAPRFHLMRVVTTNADGTWTAKVRAGPSRLIEAVYPGNGATEPARSSTVKLLVPAKVAMSISPRVIPWSGKITIRGRLVGGWVPRDGVALRLRVPYPGGQILQEPFRTDRHGRFRFRWTYKAGRGVVTYRFRVATTSTESDYPWAAAISRGVPVTFGRPTPHRRRAHHHRGRPR
jgi:hypothetical protein